MAKLGPKNQNPALVVHHSIALYVPTFGACMTAKHEAVTALRDEDGAWKFHLSLMRCDGKKIITSVTFNVDGPHVVSGDELLRWGIVRLGPGVWTLSESINVEGMFHGYIVLCDVPEPPPWKNK